MTLRSGNQKRMNRIENVMRLGFVILLFVLRLYFLRGVPWSIYTIHPNGDL